MSPMFAGLLGKGDGTHLVFTTRKEVRVPVANSETPDGRNVTGERQLEFASGQVPDLNDTITCTSCEPSVSWFDCYTSDPAKMA